MVISPWSSDEFPRPLGSGATQNHTIAATVQDDCTVTFSTRFLVTFVKFEVIGAS